MLTNICALYLICFLFSFFFNLVHSFCFWLSTKALIKLIERKTAALRSPPAFPCQHLTDFSQCFVLDLVPAVQETAGMKKINEQSEVNYLLIRRLEKVKGRERRSKSDRNRGGEERPWRRRVIACSLMSTPNPGEVSGTLQEAWDRVQTGYSSSWLTASSALRLIFIIHQCIHLLSLFHAFLFHLLAPFLSVLIKVSFVNSKINLHIKVLTELLWDRKVHLSYQPK